MIPCERQGYKDKSVLDQDSTQLTWAETVLELFDDYITGKYNVPMCVGLFWIPTLPRSPSTILMQPNLLEVTRQQRNQVQSPPVKGNHHLRLHETRSQNAR